jgi:cytoskeleton protein RodZ
MADVLRLTRDSGSELDRPMLPPCKTSADADVSLESIGQDLCKARQRSGKMLMDVWRELKIPPHHLIAIEKSRFEALPGRVYAIGFVRSYAAYLGLDAETFVARLKAEMAGPDAKLLVISPSPPPDRLEAEFAGSGDAEEAVIGPLPSPESRLPRAAMAGLLIAVLIYSGYYVVDSARRMAPPPVIPVPARLAAEAGLSQKQVGTPPATVEQPARTSGEPALAPSTEVAPTQPPVSVRPLAAVEPASALPPEPALAPSTEVAPTLPASVLAEPAPRLHAPLPLGRRYGKENRNSRITLRVHRSIRVAVQGIRNRIFIDRILAAGDTYRVPNMVGLKLSAQDAGAIEVILDDNTVGFAGKDGVTTRGLSLDPQSIIDRYHWHG